MKQWLHQWYEIYEGVWNAPFMNQEKQMLQLEQMVQQLLDTWGSLDESLRALQQRLQSESQSLMYETAGTSLFLQQDFTGAVRQLNVEQSIGEKDQIRSLYLAYAYLYLNELDESEAHFHYVKHISANASIIHFAYNGLGLIQLARQNVEAAIHFFEKALPLAENHDVVYNLGVCYFTLGHYRYATDCFSLYVNHQTDQDGLFALGLALYFDSRIEEAQTIWLRYVEKAEEAQQLEALAHLMEWIGGHELASHSYAQLIHRFGEAQTYLHGYAWNKALTGDQNGFHLLADLAKRDPEAAQSLHYIQSADL